MWLQKIYGETVTRVYAQTAMCFTFKKNKKNANQTYNVENHIHFPPARRSYDFFYAKS